MSQSAIGSTSAAGGSDGAFLVDDWMDGVRGAGRGRRTLPPRGQQVELPVTPLPSCAASFAGPSATFSGLLTGDKDESPTDEDEATSVVTVGHGVDDI